MNLNSPSLQIQHKTYNLPLCNECGGDYLECCCRNEKLIDYVEDTQHSSNAIYETLETSLRKNYLSIYLDKLSEREKTVIKYYYGLDDHPQLNLTQIAAIYKLSSERIRQIRDKALRKLRRRAKYGYAFFEYFYDYDKIKEIQRDITKQELLEEKKRQSKLAEAEVEVKKREYERRKKRQYLELNITYIPTFDDNYGPSPSRIIPSPPGNITIQDFMGIPHLYDTIEQKYINPNLDPECYNCWRDYLMSKQQKNCN